MRRIAAAAVIGAISLVATSAARADPALIERGRLVAEGHCSRCHAVGASGQSPHKIVIPFRNLAERFPVDMLVDTLRTGTIGGHDEMPMFDLGAADARALIAYIDIFAPAGQRYLSLPASKP